MLEIKKSKFFAYLFDINTLEDVEMNLQKIKSENKKASHICFAYRINYPLAEKACDDGEPSGTAGKPILNVLQKQNKQNCLLVVVRYFGGVKLGAGGLVRAYTKCASEILKDDNANN